MKKRFSELTLKETSGMAIHYDEGDALRFVTHEENLNRIKQSIISRWGDVEVEISSKGVEILDEKWKAAHKEFMERKAAWCLRHGCD